MTEQDQEGTRYEPIEIHVNQEKSFQQENKSDEHTPFFSIHLTNSDIRWAYHNGPDVSDGKVFWRTPLLDHIDFSSDANDNVKMLGFHLPHTIQRYIFQNGSITLQDAVERLKVLDEPFTFYILSSDSNENHQVTLISKLLSCIPCHLKFLKSIDFLSNEELNRFGYTSNGANLSETCTDDTQSLSQEDTVSTTDSARTESTGHTANTTESSPQDTISALTVAYIKGAASVFNKSSVLLVESNSSTITYVTSDLNGNILGYGIGPSIINLLLQSSSSQQHNKNDVSRPLTITDINSSSQSKNTNTDMETFKERLNKVFRRNGELSLFQKNEINSNSILHPLIVEESSWLERIVQTWIEQSQSDKEKPTIVVCGETEEDLTILSHMLGRNRKAFLPPSLYSENDISKYDIKQLNEIVHFGIASAVLKQRNVSIKSSKHDRDDEYEKIPEHTNTLKCIYIGNRVAKKFDKFDKDGTNIYRGTVFHKQSDSNECWFLIKYDDDDEEHLGPSELKYAMSLYRKVREKKPRGRRGRPKKRKVEDLEDLNSSNPQAYIGNRIFKPFAQTRKFGTITNYHLSYWYVLYDDGDEELINKQDLRTGIALYKCNKHEDILNEVSNGTLSV